MATSNTEAVKTDISNASSNLGDSIRNAAAVAGDELRVAKANVKGTLADAGLVGINAIESGAAVAGEQMDALMDKGRDLIESAAELVRERPLASFGVAFAAGWIIAKLARSGDK